MNREVQIAICIIGGKTQHLQLLFRLYKSQFSSNKHSNDKFKRIQFLLV